MIWDIVSSRSYFCWLYRASPSLAAKNIINLVLVLTIWWCPCVDSSLGLLKKCVFSCSFHTVPSIFCWWNSVSLCSASLCTPRPKSLVILSISCLLTFAFQSPMLKGHLFFFFLVQHLQKVLRVFIALINSASLALVVGHRLGLP